MPPDERSLGCRARPSFATGRAAITALASFGALLAAACGGEQAFNARDAGTLTGVAGTSGGAGGSMGGNGIAGSTGVAGSTGNAGGASAGVAGSDAGTAGSGSGGSGSGGSGSGGSGVGGSATGGGGATAGGGAGGAGARGGTGGGGKAAGMPCTSGAECASTFCFDDVCCQSDCTGTCRTCNPPAGTPGTCTLAPDGQDPRDQCPMETATNTCGRTGACNGSGSCRYAASTVVCDTTPACDADRGAIVSMKVCNGSGSCVAGTTQSCNGFRCTPASPPFCATSCTNDSVCITGGYCSAGTCVANPNLVGNHDLETGTTTGWLAANGGGSIALSSTAASGFSHTGTYSIVGSGRSAPYHGPGYNIPTGIGKYVISGWAMQKDLTSINGLLQIRFACKTNINPGYYMEVQSSGFGVLMPQNVWTQFSATVDTAQLNADCLPTAATPGMVRTATLYLNHDMDSVPAAPYPDLYLDDVVVQVTDGHNLVGNSNFEAGLADGWSLSAGSSSLSVVDTVAHTGTHSLRQTTRSIPAAGPRYALTNGAARYDFSIWVKHAGTQPRDLILQPTYNCITPAGPVTPAPIKTEPAVPADTWIELKGIGVFPPADAPTGCKLASAAIFVRTDGTACGGEIECPDLYVDDVTIKLTP